MTDSKQKKKALVVLRLLVKNIGPIKEVEVVPDGDLVLLTGRNGAGKTTALDAMKWTLEGGRSFTDVKDIIRDGAEEGEVEIDLGDYVIRRVWKSDNDYRLKLMAKMADGELTTIDKAPQSVLDAFGDTVGFDPLWYSRTSGEERIEYLKRFIDFDFDRLEYEIKKIYDDRRDIGRDKRNAEERIKSMEEPSEDWPTKRIDVSEAVKELEEARENNAKVTRAETRLEALRNTEAEIEADIADLYQQLEENKEAIKGGEKFLKENKKTDTDPLVEKVNSAEEINDKVRRFEEYGKLEAEVGELSEQYDAKSQEIEEAKTKKIEAIEKAKFPISGLQIGEDDISIDGRPFSRLSEGERLKYASLLVIGTEPRFKVLAVREGEKLDSGNEEILRSVAREHGFQLWIEKMDESGEVGFVFENGEIVKQNKED